MKTKTLTLTLTLTRVRVRVRVRVFVFIHSFFCLFSHHLCFADVSTSLLSIWTTLSAHRITRGADGGNVCPLLGTF